MECRRFRVSTPGTVGDSYKRWFLETCPAKAECNQQSWQRQCRCESWDSPEDCKLKKSITSRSLRTIGVRRNNRHGPCRKQRKSSSRMWMQHGSQNTSGQNQNGTELMVRRVCRRPLLQMTLQNTRRCCKSLLQRQRPIRSTRCEVIRRHRLWQSRRQLRHHRS